MVATRAGQEGRVFIAAISLGDWPPISAWNVTTACSRSPAWINRSIFSATARLRSTGSCTGGS